MTERALDRKLVGNLTVEQCLYIAVLAAATFLRLYILGIRPYHHDESIHAFFSWKIVDQGVGDYNYDPVYHGPLLYYATALMLWLFGDNDFTGRLSAVAFGLGVLGFAWPLRRYLGRTGALAFLILATFSPSFTYFTRFVRHDIYLALCNLAAVYFAFRYAETRTARYLYISGAAFALAFCTKEDMYVVGPMLVFALVLMMVWEVVHGSQTVRGAVAETTELLRRAVLPLLTTAVIFAVVWVLLYTSLLTHPKNWLAIGRALSYWMGQHEIKRIGGPWYYYVPQLTLYDPIIFFGAVAFMLAPFLQAGKPDPVLRAMRYAAGIGVVIFVALLVRAPESRVTPLVFVAVLGAAQIGVARVWLPDRFTRFVILWTLGSLCFYGWAQEKVPWLLVPQVLPLTMVAALWVARLIESGAIRRPATLLPLAAVAGLTAWILIASNYWYDAPRPDEPADRRHGELLAYVQSTYDIHKVMRRIEDIGATLGTGTQTRLAVSGDATWPMSWYLRHYPVNWAADVRNVDTPVVIVNKDITNSLDQPLADKYEKIPFEIRGWWEPAWGQANLPKLMRWLLTREVFSPVGSSDAVMYAAKDVVPGMSFAPIAVNPPPAARGYGQQPKLISAAAIWGKQGSAAGEFNEPRALALDTAGNLYVMDSHNQRVQKLGPDGRVLLTWGHEGNGPGEFKDPCGIAVATDGSVYVADTWNHRLQKFDANGRFILQWAEENPGLWGPRGVAVSPVDGTVYVTDTGNKRVLAYSPDGKRTAVWGKDGSKPGELIEPVGIAVDANGAVYVADTGNKRVQVFDAKGTFKDEWPISGWEEFYTEPYLAVSSTALFVTDSHNQHFARYANKQLTGVWGKSGSGSGDFNHPIGIAVDAQGAVYISDTMNHRVQKFELPKD